MAYLLFCLYGPMASWGEVAVGEFRPAGSFPGKSAVCGLVAAALGIPRHQEKEHIALSEGYDMGGVVLSPGTPMKDFHTAQVPDRVGKYTYRNRREEVVAGKARLHTTLSFREYRTDMAALVALRPRPEAPWDLERLEEALRYPVFSLYLGRKSCPPAHPLCPALLAADGFHDALIRYEQQVTGRFLPKPSFTNHGPRRFFWEGSTNDFAPHGMPKGAVYTVERHHGIRSRKRWQFAKLSMQILVEEGKG